MKCSSNGDEPVHLGSDTCSHNAFCEVSKFHPLNQPTLPVFSIQHIDLENILSSFVLFEIRSVRFQSYIIYVLGLPKQKRMVF